MREFVVSTESGGDLSQKYIAAHDIRIIPMYYTIAGEEYGAGKELPPEEFYGKMREGEVGKTVACNPAVIEEVFRSVLEEGKDLLHIGFDKSMSSTVDTEKMLAEQLAEEYPEARILVLDSFSASLGEGILAARAQEMKESGASFDETAEEIKRLVPHMSVVSTVDDMEETIGSWRDKQLRVGIVHADCIDDAKRLKEMVEERFGYDDVFIAPLGPTLGAHSGPGTLGLIFLADRR